MSIPYLDKPSSHQSLPMNQRQEGKSCLDQETLEVIAALGDALHATLSDLQQIHGGKTPKIATAALKRAGEFVRSRSDRVRYSK